MVSDFGSPYAVSLLLMKFFQSTNMMKFLSFFIHIKVFILLSMKFCKSTNVFCDFKFSRGVVSLSLSFPSLKYLSSRYS